MSKKLFRKGLAISAAVALGLTGISALPASSAGLADTTFVSLVPTDGTEYTVVAGAGNIFSLRSNEASTIDGTNRDLKWLVEDSAELTRPNIATTGFTTDYVTEVNRAGDTSTVDDWSRTSNVVTVTLGVNDNDPGNSGGATTQRTHSLNVGDLIYVPANTFLATGVATSNVDAGYYEITAVPSSASYSFESVDANVTAGNATVADNVAIEASRGAARDADGFYVVDSLADTADTVETLVLESLSANTATVKVTAWVDTNTNGEIDSTEYVSPTRTVTFIKDTELAVSTELVTPKIGDPNLVAYVTTTPVLNGLQTLNNGTVVKVDFSRQGESGTETDSSASWNDTLKRFQSLSVALNAGAWDASTLVIAGSYSATGTVGTKEGSTSTKVVAAPKADDIKATVTGSANVQPATNANANSGATSLVRVGTNAVAVAVVVEDVDDAPVGAGVVVEATVSGKAGTGTFTVNGTTAVDGTVVEATTNSAGAVTFTVNSSAALEANAITLTITSEGLSGTSGAAVTFDWTAANYSIVDVADISDSGYRTINQGGSTTINYAVVDQWSQALAGTYRLKVAQSSYKSATTFHNLSSGRTSVTITDDAGQGLTGTIEINVTLQTQVSGNWVDTSSANIGAETFSGPYVDVIKAQTDFVDIQSGTSESEDVAFERIYSVDTRFSQEMAPSVTETEIAYIYGEVENAITASTKRGAPVTISGAGLTFFATQGENGSSQEIWAKDSLTLFTDSAGDFDFYVVSNKAVKDQVVSISSGGSTKTVKVTFLALEAVDAEVVANLSVKAGRSLNVTVRFLDKWDNFATGNNTATTRVSGAGWLTNEASQTAVNGVISLRLITQTEDYGIAAISATTNVLDTNDAAIVATDAVWVGPIANAKAGGKKGSIVVETYRAKGKTVSVFVGSTRVATYVPTLQNHRKVVYVKNSGTRNVRVVLSGAGQDFRGAVTVK